MAGKDKGNRETRKPKKEKAPKAPAPVPGAVAKKG